MEGQEAPGGEKWLELSEEISCRQDAYEEHDHHLLNNHCFHIAPQVEKEERNMPLCLSTLLGEAFARCNATVHYSLEADNDDTLAAYAQVGASGGPAERGGSDCFVFLYDPESGYDALTSFIGQQCSHYIG